MTTKYQAKQIRRKLLEVNLGSRYEKSSLFYDSDLQFNCAYCGTYINPETSVGDHVIPLFAMKEMVKIDPNVKSEIVPCCRKCNAIAGSNVFVSFLEKKSYIQSRYEKKHVKRAYHTKAELKELGYNLKTMLDRYNAETKQLLEYSQWDCGYIGENHKYNKKLKNFFYLYSHVKEKFDPRTNYPTWVSPDEFPRPWADMNEAKELLDANRGDVINCVFAEELEFTIVDNKYQFNYNQLIDLKKQLTLGDFDLRDIKDVAKQNKKKFLN